MPERRAVRTVSKTPEILQLSYGLEQANTYLVVENGHAVVIDACSASVADEIKNRGLAPDYVLLTHEHVDHLWGLNAIREVFPDVKVIAQKRCSEAIQSSKANKAAQYRIYAILRFGEEYQNTEAENRKYFCNRAEIEFDDSYEFEWSEHRIRIVHTPGHSPGSSIIFFDDSIAFSGDTLLNEDTFLKFDGGDVQLFNDVTIPIINSIADEAKILPGHGEPFIKRDWKKPNG